MWLQVIAFTGACCSWGWKDFLPLGAFLWGRGFPQISFPYTKLYTVTGMYMAAAFTTGIWVAAVEMATVGEGSAGRTEFMGKVGMAGIGWMITLILSLLFTGVLALLFFSAFLGTKVFLVEEFLSWKGVLVHGHEWGWGWGLGLGPSLPSSSRYILIFLIKDGYRWSLVLQGLHDMTWVVPSLLNVWIPLIIFTFTSMSTVSNGSRHLK